ncbi:50S ribosomal protein L22 [Candidatus Mycoplasma mahonii]|uniref:50S ribosomal protein L22 n=1 Tax=Candidatus Mycoplasma mahonii TaxID=3004105 RepID=UPI0026EC41D3|nr:50S ribosomal protein L22 [Candidatus Mycoplasma mahonii]WKX02248.1 50S ribosomal protein L22 [Candidatus Mycoplasma mahonii]
MAQAHASIKLQRVSARKARLVADLFREQNVSDALATLKNTPKKSTVLFIKLLNSAIANGVNNHGMNAEKLFVSKVVVNEGPTLKRFQPRSQGRAYSIFKRTSHLLVEVSER